MSEALEKINSQIQYALSYELRAEFPDAIISITKVNTTPDLDFCDILVSVLGDDEFTIKKLNDHSKSLRMKLAKSINLRRTPQLRFYFDSSDKEYQKIDELLKNN